MKIIIALLACQLMAQTNFPRLSGSNPSEDLGSVTYNVGTIRVFTGTGIPSSPTPLVTGVPAVRGDFYLDTAATIFYQCNAVTCMAANQWSRVAYPTVVSVTAFGVNGSSSDATNLQTALTAASGNFCLYVPTGLTINMAGNHVSIPNTCISGDGPALSKVQSTGQATTSVGVWDITAGDTNVSIQNIGFDGGITVATGMLYSAAVSAGPNGLATGSMFWIHGPSSGIFFQGDLIQHVGGYSIFSDTTGGNISGISITKCTFQNNRPNLFGTSGGAEFYGSWTGGVIFWGPGTTYSFSNVIADNNTFQNMTGNALWTSNTALTVANRGFRFTNNTFYDTGLDCIQVNNVNGYVETGNKSFRNGYVITSDVGATRVGGPMWLQSYVPSVYDGGFATQNATRGNNTADSFNGGMIDADGTAYSSIFNNMGTSCFASVDPLASSSSCGPSSSVGVNWTYGLTVNNSMAVVNGAYGLSITGNNFNGVGESGMSLYGIRFSIISGNYITQSANNSNPIVIGNLTGQQATANYVTANYIYWTPASGAPAVFEDGVTYAAFASVDTNVVKNNFVGPPGGNAYEFQKATPDYSGTGNQSLCSVTPGAASLTCVVQQVEGSSGNPDYKLYLNNGSGTLLSNWSGGGYEPMSVTYLQLPSASIYPASIVTCSNCTATGSVEGGICTSGGSTPMLAFSNGTNWKCFF